MDLFITALEKNDEEKKYEEKTQLGRAIFFINDEYQLIIEFFVEILSAYSWSLSANYLILFLFSTHFPHCSRIW